jgi:DNA-binding beta-propeller fold protein YncE
MMTLLSHWLRGWCERAGRRARPVAPAVAGLAVLVAAVPAGAQDYEVWALDQGTSVVHIFNAQLEEVGRIDMAAHGVAVPHMIDFTSDHAYAFIASTKSGDVSVIRTADRAVLAVLKTGPGTHMAAVKPDDSAVIVDVIGDGKVERDGKLVEITIDRQNEAFAVGRSLVIADDPLVQQAGDKFKDIGAVCHEYSSDGRHAFVTLGPALKDGGLVVLDTVDFKLVAAYPPDELKVNCGTARTTDGRHMFLNGGGAEVGVWYVMDIATREIVHQADSGGLDAHGVWATPDGREVWMVNRVSSNAIVIDPATFEVVGKLTDIGKTPDIIAMSPDSRLAFVTLRGPHPMSAAHVAVGDTPGFAVISVPDRKLVKVVRPAEGNDQSDFHGIGVRPLGG